MKEKGKELIDRVPEGVLLASIVILACCFSFGLGMLFERESRGGEVTLEYLPLIPPTLEASQEAEADTAHAQVGTPVMATGGQYVASKNGTKYHFPWCPGAKAMNEANKVWFSTQEEAEKAGYTKAANCKGL